ncbi:glutaminyl-peptide cyclotransferase [Sphingomonas crusticola]|uniref:glutaminyl-peptide cyclotransferase n=1 Tax=Sphingomonas crusticola TaxID=1697973 RepID=UPI000E24D050|nr:glutaminyl-peptide cyclotransferase [Sphingomonas crusticola]
MICRILSLMLVLLGWPAAAALPVTQAQVVRTYPHDTSAFTEGLLIRDGWLYESTGYEGQSFIRKKELATGRIVQSITIPRPLFGEGIVDWGNRLYSFVWHGGKGFIWTLPGLKAAGNWTYSGEGWAMTQDGRQIIMSDGTPVLRFLDPKTMKVTRRLTVTAEGQPVALLNELEYVRGEILANVWQTALIARIDPNSGKVKGWIDLAALWTRVQVANDDAVPNGIAYDKKSGRLFVTGKNWPTLFEIKLPGGR